MPNRLSLLIVVSSIFFCNTLDGQEKNLEYFVSAAIQSSPLLKDLQFQQQSNLIDSLRLRAGYGVQINGSSTNSYAPYHNGWGYDYAITNGTNLSELVTFSKDILRKNYLQNQYAAIRILNDALRVNGRIAEQDITRSVSTQYVIAYGSYQQLQVSRELTTLLANEETILKHLATQAVYRQTDYLSFLVTLQQQQLATEQLLGQYQNDYALLNYLCGLRDTSFTALQPPGIQPYTIPSLEETVFYQKFQIDSLKLRNSDAQIDFNYKPKVSVYGDGGYVSSLAIDPYKNFGASVGLNLTVPIYDGRQRKMQHDKVQIDELNRRQSQDFFKTQYDQQIAQLFQQLNTAEKLIVQSNNQVKYAEALIDANRKLMSAGDAKIADYIIAIGNYLNAKNAITLNTVNRYQIIIQINYWNKK
jgi:outer membrane protein TolC